MPLIEVLEHMGTYLFRVGQPSIFRVLLYKLPNSILGYFEDFPFDSVANAISYVTDDFGRQGSLLDGSIVSPDHNSILGKVLNLQTFMSGFLGYPLLLTMSREGLPTTSPN